MLKFIRPDRVTVPAGTERITVHAVVESELVEAWLEGIGQTPWRILVDDAPEFHFDCGGIVKQNEPILQHQFDGWTLSVLLRHAEDLRECAGRVQEHLDVLGPHVYLPGYWVKAVLTVETGRQIVEWLDYELDGGKIAEADQQWAEHAEQMREKGVYVPPRRIG